MPVNRILSAEREKIVVSGELSDQLVQSVFASVTGSSPVVSVTCEYDNKTNRTTIQILPYHIFIIDLPPEYEKRFGDGISRERRVVFPGVIFDSTCIVDRFVEKFWVPTRKRAKKDSDDLKWVVVTPCIVKDSVSGKSSTEFSFFIETLDPKSHDPRGCAPENIKATLDRATDLVVKEMCRIIKADEEHNVLEATYVMNEFSSAFAEGLEKALTDAEQAEVFPNG